MQLVSILEQPIRLPGSPRSGELQPTDSSRPIRRTAASLALRYNTAFRGNQDDGDSERMQRIIKSHQDDPDYLIHLNHMEQERERAEYELQEVIRLQREQEEADRRRNEGK